MRYKLQSKMHGWHQAFVYRRGHVVPQSHQLISGLPSAYWERQLHQLCRNHWDWHLVFSLNCEANCFTHFSPSSGGLSCQIPNLVVHMALFCRPLFQWPPLRLFQRTCIFHWCLQIHHAVRWSAWNRLDSSNWNFSLVLWSCSFLQLNFGLLHGFPC